MTIDDEDTRLQQRRQAAATRAAAAPPIALLSRPESPHLTAIRRTTGSGAPGDYES